jgi:Rrf2 family transcriptional regulator, iron-sulfur cluster assembly transcription factor
MMLTTKGRYAVMAMVDLVHYRSNGKATALHEISERQNITINYLEQLFNKLKKKQLVESIKGPGGGYNLKINAKDITILDVILAVGESIKITRCEASNKGCLGSNHKICLTHVLWEGLGLQISNYLKSISLQDVCDNLSIVEEKR